MNALRALGIKMSEKRIMAHTSTTRAEGTSEHGILNGIERVGFNWEEIKVEDQDEAWAAVTDSISEGHPVILSVDNADHWITVIGAIGDCVVVFDSDSVNEHNRKEHGTHIWTVEQLFERWKMVNEQYYGISVKEPE
jgi:ABC-type bacteriocin/lantibiotic exporter with double-glycine peptidase domain